MSKLVLFLADSTTLDVPLKRERITVGRRPDNDVCLANLAVSGEHAAVVTILADSFLEDLGSTNGTLVNGKPVTKHFLRDGDHIDIGRHLLIYCVNDDAVLSVDLIRAASRDGTSGGRAPSGDSSGAPRESEGNAMRRARIAANMAAARVTTDDKPDGSANPSGPSESTARIPQIQPAIASVKVVSGPGAGRLIPITKDEVTIGRAGVQVALIRRSGGSFELRPVEGPAPVVNARGVGADGAPLSVGDVIEIVGTKVEFGGIPGSFGGIPGSVSAA